MSCLACGATKPPRASGLTYVGDSASVSSELVVCEQCGLGRLQPPPLAKSLNAFYNDVGYRVPGSVFGVLTDSLLDSLVAVRCRRVERALRQKGVVASGASSAPRLLDVGCGKGRFLRAATLAAWNAEGVEPWPPSAVQARERSGAPVTDGTLADARFPDARWDAATMWHVLEHVPDPDGVIAELSRVVRPGGVLAVAVPNFGSWQARMFGATWYHLQLPGHLFHFSPKALRSMLERHGFRVVRRTRHSFDLGYFAMVASVAGRLLGDGNALVRILKPGGKWTGRARKLLMASAVLIALLPLSIPFLAVEAIGSLFGAGGDLEIYAVRDV